MATNDAPTDPLVAEVLLSLIPGVGPRTRKSLLAHFGSAQAVLAAAASDLREVPGIGTKLSRAIVTGRQELDASAELADCAANGVALLAESAEGYPARLREIPDPPGVLFLRGGLIPSDGIAVAIVGTRHATQYGMAQAERLAFGLAKAGYTIVSGLARGIDAAAHRGALQAGGRTIAVLGSGVLNIYPPEHVDLATEISTQGAVLGENPPRSPPLSGAFPQRNRIITGLSLGTIVVEASDRSGALISARHAMEQGREVFAVPGRVDSRTSRGCHRLIRDGAKLVETVEDVLEELGPLATPTAAPHAPDREIRHPAELQLNAPEQAVLAAIGDDPTAIDEIVVASGLSVPNVLSTLSVLEMRRLVRRVGGSRVIRAFRPEA
ncbi:MAG: DNA-processing protein DprA [Pirellulaceae bacterium]|nr:DNA-processing protein DprA [Pirellulaceae bacterium]